VRDRITVPAAVAPTLAAVVAAFGHAQQATTFTASTEVIASRVTDRAEEAGRREVLLTRDEIRALPAHNINELLAILPGVGLTRRGAFGAQADLNLRGSTVDVDPLRSAYALAHPRLEVAWTGTLELGRVWSGGWSARLRDPNNGPAWATLDLRLGRRILGGTILTLEAANVFDRHITELHGIPLPGRWLSVRLDWREGR